MSENEDSNQNFGGGTRSSNQSPVKPSASLARALESDERNTRRIKIIAGIVVVVFAVLAVFNGLKHRTPTTPLHRAAPESDPEEIAKRTAVQDFILTDAAGQTKKLSDFRGNVVILSFWASWCAPCLEELSTFAQLRKRFDDRGLRVIPVNMEEGDDGKNFAKKFWTAQRFDLPSFFDTSKELASQFQVEMLPANFVIDREGRLAFSSFGANDWTNPETVEFLESLLQEPPR